MKYSFFISLFFILACATVTPPDGGPVDTAPPKVLSSYPDSAQLSVSPSFFSFTFDEYVKANQIQDLLIISPTLSSKPKTEIKKKTLYIRFDDSLKSNTTYSVSLSGCILDYNEGNVLANHHLAFSTGEVLDSLNYSAFIRNAYTKEPCGECLLLLYNHSKDSGALLYRPTYLAQSNAAGYATIPNLAEGTYWVQALLDENKNLLLNTDELTSLREQVFISDSIKQDTFQVFPHQPTIEKKISYKMRRAGVALLTFQPPMTSTNFSVELNGQEINADFNMLRDSAKLYFAAKSGDSITLIVQWDTVSQSFSDIIKEVKPYSKLKYSLKNDILQLENYHQISMFDSSKIILKEDSTIFNIKEHTFNGNTVNIRLNQTPSKKLSIRLLDSAITNLNGQINRLDSSVVDAYNPESSSLTLDLKLSTDGLYIVQLIKREKIVDQKQIRSSQKINYEGLGVGSYSFRIIMDTNENSIWDTGNYLNSLAPEPLILSESTDLRPNWDKELIISY